MADLAQLQWDDIRVFLVLLGANTIREAAATLGVNPTTVGRRLDALEDVVGTTLFERGRGGIFPTAAAEHLAPAARHFARSAAGFAHAVGGLETRAEGEVVISAATGIANLLLVPLLPELATRHPGIRVVLDVNNAFADLDRHDADLAIRISRPGVDLHGGSNLVTRLLARAALVPIAHPEYADALGTLADLNDATWVTFGKRMSGFSWARKVLDHVDRSRILLRTDDPNAVFNAVAAGLGATWATRNFVDGDRFAEVALSPHLNHLIDEPDSMWLVGHRSLRDVPRVSAVWSFLVEKLMR